MENTEKKLTIGEKLRRIGELREQERYEKTRSKSLPSVEDLKKKFKLREQSTENLSPEINKILSLVKTSEDDKKRATKESADIAKKNVEQISGLNDSFGRILTSQVKTTGLLKQLLQTVTDNKEEESKQRKSWFSRLVDAAVGVLAVGGAGFLGAAAMNRASEINGTPAVPPVMPEAIPQPAPTAMPQQSQSAPATAPQAALQRNSEMREESAVQQQPRQTAAAIAPSLSMPASYRAQGNDTETTLAAPATAPRSFPKEPASAPLSMSTRAQPKNDDVNATPLYNDNTSANPKAPVAEAVNRPSVEPALRDLPSSLHDYTFKANEIKFKADEFKFEQQATPVLGANESALGSNITPISMAMPQLGGSLGGGGGASPPSGGGGRGGTLEQLDPAIRSIYERLRSEFPGLSHTSTTEGRLGVAGQAAHGEGKAIDLNMAGLDQAARERLVAAIASIPEVTGIGLYPNSNPNMLHVDAGYTGGRRSGVQRMAWGDNGSRTSLPQTPEWFQNIINPWMSGGSATRVQTAASAPTTAPAATQQTASAQAPIPVPSPQAQVGPALAAASAQRSMSMDMPAPPAPTVVQMSTPDDTGSAPPGFGGPQYPLDPNDPGPVEPSNSLQRYSRLFDMAA
jgi:hypothetical protein